MASRLCGCVCSNLLFLANYQQGSARISLRNLDQIPTSLSSPPQLISKLLDPWEEQQEHASSRRITTMVNEIAGEVRSGQRKVVVLGAPPGRALGVGAPQRAPRNTPGGRVISGNSGLVPLEVIKAKAALNVSDWDLDDLDENVSSHAASSRQRDLPTDADADAILAEHEEGSLLSNGKLMGNATVEAFSLFRNSINILKHDLAQDVTVPWAGR
mmetsp:Transcript_67819/g.99187  ORF Transcript_67819/g.99187 Transcript_67819/m.99187 type:complete len:214 (+) Transcript_67819:196-837(+)